jgi:drug/metabolite transporter (DMT)-like permease
MTAPASGPPARHPPLSAVLIGTLPPLFWSGNFLVARVMAETIPPIQMSFWRWVTALVILAPFALPLVAAHRATLRRELPFLIVLGAVGITAFNCFVYAALHYTTVVNAALINSLMPVITFLFALVLLRDRPGARQMAGVAIALVGAAVIIARGDVGALASLGFNRGDLLVLAGLTFWALYTVLIRWRRTALPMTLFLAVTIFFGVLFHLPFIAWEYPRAGAMPVTMETLAAIAFFAVFPSVLAYIFWNRTVAALGPGRTGMFMYLMPVFSSVLGVGLLGEAFHLYHWAGIALIFAGIALTTGFGAARAAPKEPR